MHVLPCLLLIQKNNPMRQALAFSHLVVFLFGFLGFSAYAVNADPATENREAQAWLRKIQSAAQRLNYSGTFIYQQSNQVRSSRITHVIEGKNEVEKLEILDGKPREYIRHNDEIAFYMPEAKVVLVEKRVTQDVFPSILAANPQDLANHYHLKRTEAGRVAGRDCQVIFLDPKDDWRFGYKLWADKSTGLLLRAQTLNEKHEVVEQISFSQITIGNIEPGRVKSSFTNTAGWRIETSSTTPAHLNGWIIRWVPPGFKKTRELKRTVADPSATLGSGHMKEVVQLVFSDGLAAISIFIEPGTQSRTEGSMQQGATNIMGKRQGDFWLTIVGEVPSNAIKQVANSIEYNPK
jgi:sigma-E factor negative regulatory protein RseB